MSRVFLKREFGINWVEYANIKKTDDNSTITISNGDDHTLIKSDEDIILNGRRMGGFLLYSGSGKLYIDRLAENERVFIAESLEIEVRLLAVNLISMLTLTLGLEPDFEILSQDKKFMQSLQYAKRKIDQKYDKLLELPSRPHPN